MVIIVLMYKLGVQYQYAIPAVCAYAHNFLEQKGCALIGACVLIRMNTVCICLLQGNCTVDSFDLATLIFLVQ